MTATEKDQRKPFAIINLESLDDVGKIHFEVEIVRLNISPGDVLC